MEDETATDTTETETSTTEATETGQTTETTEAAESEASGADDKSLMTGGKADGEEKAEDDKGPDLPEKYELTPPEGFDVSDALLSAADPVFRDIGLTNEQANKLMPLVPQFAEALFAQQNDAFQAQATDWAKQARADPVLGGKNWPETESLVAKAMDVAGEKLPPLTRRDADGKTVTLSGAEQIAEFKQLLGNTKLGNHPIMMRMFRFYGSQFSEAGEIARTDSAAPVKQDRLTALYPNDVPKEAAH